MYAFIKHFLVCIFTIALSVNTIATNYYISSEGNDSSKGTSPREAWSSLDRVNNLVPKPGDSILFRRGDEWSGTVTVNMFGKDGSPIVYGAYGKGSKPRIYGSEVITGWTKHQENIYKAHFNKSVNQLFLEEEKMIAARYPNSGFIFITSVTGTAFLSADELDKTVDYSGALWFGRTHYFTTSLLEVESSSLKTLKVKQPPRFPLKEGLGFFLMNKLEFLDQPGEWFYDDKEKMIYLYTPKGDSPENYTVRGSVHNDGFYLSVKNHITIRDLHFLHQAEKGIHIRNSNFIVAENNDFTYPDGFGIYCRTESSGFTIRNNTISGANHYGMYLRISHSKISENKLSRIALFEKIGLSGTGEDNFGGGIYLAGEKGNNTVSYNRLEQLGFTGILFARPKNIIEYNYIKDVCLLKGDMGGIYTSWYNRSSSEGPEGSVIRYNIIINVVGEKYGYTSNRHMGEGIYIDENASGVTIENNTIAHITNSGIKLHKTENILVKNNILFDTRQSVHILRSEGKNANKILNNTMVAAQDKDDYLKCQVLVNESSGNALYDDNKYIHLHTEKEIFLNDSKYYSFDKWKSLKKHEGNSITIPSALLPGEKEIIVYNDTRQVKKINIQGKNLKDIKGNKISQPIHLQPFTSAIIIAGNADTQLY